MTRAISIVTAVLILGASAAKAETTNCRWHGSTWTCQTQPQVPGPDYEALQNSQKQLNQTIMNGLWYRRQMEMENTERLRLQAERNQRSYEADMSASASRYNKCLEQVEKALSASQFEAAEAIAKICK